MPKTLIPMTSWSPDAGEFSPPNNGFLCVENISPSAFGYEKQYVFAAHSTRNPLFNGAYLGNAIADPQRIASYSVPLFDNGTGSYTDNEEWVFIFDKDAIYLKKGSEAVDNVSNNASSGWAVAPSESNGDLSHTRFGQFVLAATLGSRIHIFDMNSWTAAGTHDFLPISLPSGVPNFTCKLMTTHKSNVFVADVNFDSPFEGYSDHVPDILMWTDDYSAENFGSPVLTPHLAGNGYILMRDNYGPIRALCSANEVLFVFKENAVYRIDGPPYSPQLIFSGIGTIYKNTVFAVGGIVYFWSQFGPTRIVGQGLEILGHNGGWSRLITGGDSFVPIAYPAYKHPIIDDEVTSGEKLTNIPCGAYDSKTDNVLFGFHGKVRKMQTNSVSSYAGYLKQNIFKRRGLTAGTVHEHSRTVCNVLLTINQSSGLASVSYPMSMQSALNGNPNKYGFRGLSQREVFGSVICAFKSNTGYEALGDYETFLIGSMTAEDTHYVTGGSVFASHLAATEYNPICITSPFIRCPESDSGTQWKINRVRPVFAHQSEFSFSYAIDGDDGPGEIIPKMYIHNSSGTMKKYIPITFDGFNDEGWILINRDIYSTFKSIEFELYRSSSGFSGEESGVSSHVPWIGRFVGFEVEYDVMRKRSI